MAQPEEGGIIQRPRGALQLQSVKKKKKERKRSGGGGGDHSLLSLSCGSTLSVYRPRLHRYIVVVFYAPKNFFDHSYDTKLTPVAGATFM